MGVGTIGRATGAPAADAVVRCSRSGRVARGGQGLEERLERLRRGEGGVAVVACDVAQEEGVVAMLRSAPREVDGAPGTALRRLRSVLHTAGTTRDRLMLNTGRDELAAVMAPKALGARHLHGATSQAAAAAFVLFSSIASTFGNVGQASERRQDATIRRATPHTAPAYRPPRGLPSFL